MLEIAGTFMDSRLIMGTALYPSPESLKASLIASGAEVITVSLRRESSSQFAGDSFINLIADTKLKLLPNTAGSFSAEQAILTARMARTMFNTNWIKLEVIADAETLHPDPYELLKAAKTLVAEGFEVFPYATDDLVLAQRLVESGCRVVMPWAAPIGSGQGPANIRALETMRNRLPDTVLIVDAGIGKPSHAATVMEMGFDAVLLNSAVALSGNPVRMAAAFGEAVRAGRNGFLSGMMPVRNFASASTPTIGTPFWHEEVVRCK